VNYSGDAEVIALLSQSENSNEGSKFGSKIDRKLESIHAEAISVNSQTQEF
jgi:hypothetical protein